MKRRTALEIEIEDGPLSEETGMARGASHAGRPPRYAYEDHPQRNLLALCDNLISVAEIEIENCRTGGGDVSPHVGAEYYAGKRNAAQSMKSYILLHTVTI